jgi:hypothetical protein
MKVHKRAITALGRVYDWELKGPHSAHVLVRLKGSALEHEVKEEAAETADMMPDDEEAWFGTLSRPCLRFKL